MKEFCFVDSSDEEIDLKINLPEENDSSLPTERDFLFAYYRSELGKVCDVYSTRGHALYNGELNALLEKTKEKYGESSCILIGRKYIIPLHRIAKICPKQELLALYAWTDKPQNKQNIACRVWLRIQLGEDTLAELMHAQREAYQTKRTVAVGNKYEVKPSPDTFAISNDERLLLLRPKEIKYVRSWNSYLSALDRKDEESNPRKSVVFFTDQSMLEVPFPIGDINKQLNGKDYECAARSVLINLDYVDSRRSCMGRLIMKDGDTGIVLGRDVSSHVWNKFIARYNTPQTRGGCSSGLGFITASYPEQPTGFKLFEIL